MSCRNEYVDAEFLTKFAVARIRGVSRTRDRAAAPEQDHNLQVAVDDLWVA
jgi:hypothetical protein